jgi:hypothetical protein
MTETVDQKVDFPYQFFIAVFFFGAILIYFTFYSAQLVGFVVTKFLSFLLPKRQYLSIGTTQFFVLKNSSNRERLSKIVVNVHFAV